VLNAGFMGYEADAATRLMWRDPPENTPDWFRHVDMVFTGYFVVELVLRILSERGYFFVNPQEWKWHWMDMALVVSSILADCDAGVDLSFFRLLRVFRLTRVAKVIRLFKFFRQLRKMMLSIYASFASLAWAFSFLLLIMFMFAVFFLNGVHAHLHGLDFDPTERELFVEWYSSLPQTMFGLLVSVSGGTDWLTIMAPVTRVSWVYQVVFVFYVLFVVIGVLNVLTGVFLESAGDFRDRDLTVQAEVDNLDGFVMEMLDLFAEFHPDHDSEVTWETFENMLHLEPVEAYLSSHMVETEHAKMLFWMLDHNHSGTISIHEFVIGLLRLKGGAKTYDSRVMLQELISLKKALAGLAEDLASLRPYPRNGAPTERINGAQQKQIVTGRVSTHTMEI
jgi:hypothetical protein